MKKHISQLRTKIIESYRSRTNTKIGESYASRISTKLSGRDISYIKDSHDHEMQYVSQFKSIQNTVDVRVANSSRSDSQEQILGVKHGGIKKTVETHVLTSERD